MKSAVWTTSRFTAMAGLALLVQAGCGEAPTPDSVSDVSNGAATGPHTITFHVPEMSDRLKLL